MGKKHKIIITGTGRAGTTFLVRLFTELGLDTGYTKGSDKGIHKNCNAGLERCNDISNHYINKCPYYKTQITDAMKLYSIDMVFIPIRNLEDSANSRIKLGKKPGGFFEVEKAEDQLDTITSKMGQLISDVVLNDIPYTFLKFPEIVQNPEYTYNKLLPFVHVSLDEFKSIFLSLAPKTKSDYYKNKK